MTARVQCPRCGEHRLLDADLALGQWYCRVCAATWPMEARHA